MQQEHQQHEEFCEREDKGISSYEELLDSRKITFTDLKEHLSGPVISILLHVILLALLATIIVIDRPEEPDEIPPVVMRDFEIPVIKKIKELPKVKPEETKEDIKIERPVVEVEPVKVEMDDEHFKNSEFKVEVQTVLRLNPSLSPTQIPALMNRGPKRKKDILDKYKAPKGTESAVHRGLVWLKNHQNSDGSWGDSAKNNFAAYTGMALLAFLAYGDTPASAEFKPTVNKAIRKLVEMVGPEADKVPGGYRHGIAMYALAEAYAVTQIPRLKDIVDKGTARIIKGMNSGGSFDYGYKQGARSDLSVAGWNYQALKAAFCAGCRVEGLEEAMRKGAEIGLKRTHYDSERQMFCYGAGSGPKSTMTAVGVLCLQLFGEGKSDEAEGGFEALKSPDNFWFNWVGGPDEKVPGWALYQWYYQTQAIFQGTSGKGRTWDAWNKMFSSQLMKKQKDDGRWETPAYEHNPAKKGHGEASFKGLDQPVYATSLCCLMLEVYYRYLPTFNVLKNYSSAEKDGEGPKKEDDLGLSLENVL